MRSAALFTVAPNMSNDADSAPNSTLRNLMRNFFPNGDSNQRSFHVTRLEQDADMCGKNPLTSKYKSRDWQLHSLVLASILYDI